MNDLQMVTSKICSVREILDSAIEAHENHKHEKVEALMYAADEYLKYYLKDFDEKFKLAWEETVTKQNKKMQEDCMPPWGHSDLEYLVNNSKRWCLPVNVDGLTGECYVQFPDDLLEAANLKEGDTVQWVDNGDGSYTIKKIQ